MKIIGKGSIVRLDGKPKTSKSRCDKWRLKVETEAGLKTRRVSGTWTQAREALDMFIIELEDTPLETSTFSAYADKWVEYREKCGDFAKRTIAKNKYNLKSIKAHIGTMSLTDITSDTIKDMYIAMREGQTLSGKPYSGTTLNQVHQVLHAVLTDALNDELISKDPMARIKPPKKDTQEKKALSADAMNDFLEALGKRNLRGQIVGAKLAILTGMRRSEIVSIRWCDYDGRALYVTNAAEDNGDLKDPKNTKSKRLIPLTKDMRDTLDRWYKVQANRLAKNNIQRTDDFFIVTEKGGEGVQPWSLGKWWTRNRESLGVPEYTLHELRHTYLTRLVHSGVSLKAAVDIAGHAKPDMIMQIYAHTDEEKLFEAVELFEQELTGKGTKNESK